MPCTTITVGVGLTWKSGKICFVDLNVSSWVSYQLKKIIKMNDDVYFIWTTLLPIIVNLFNIVYTLYILHITYTHTMYVKYKKINTYVYTNSK